MTVRRVPMGDLVHLVRRPVEVSASSEYREIGVRSFGRGIFHKTTVTGAEIGAKRVFMIAAGDLVVSNVFAWEGAVAVAAQSEEGRIGSHRFMTWIPSSDQVDVRYLLHYLTSDLGVDQLRRASPGSAGRNKTLSIRAFEQLRIPLPDPDRQRAIVDRLDRFPAVARSQPDGELDSAVGLMNRLEAQVIERFMAKHAVDLSCLVEVNPHVPQMPDEPVHFVPMADVDEHTGTIVGNQLVSREDLGGGYKRFSAGDIIFARITPCMQNGKIAIFDGSKSGLGYGSTEFHVLRPRVADLAEALHALLRTSWLRSLAEQRFTGTAGQQRVPAEFLRTVLVPDLASSGGRELALALQAIDRDRRTLRKLVKHRKDLFGALPRAARNEVFSKLV